MASYGFGPMQETRMQLALLFGAPVLIGLGYLAYRKVSSNRSCGFNAACIKGHKGLKPNKKKNSKLNDAELTLLREATMYKVEGNNCYRNGKFNKAIIFYDKAIDKCPPDDKIELAIFYDSRAAAYEKLKKWTAVKEDCTRSIEANPCYAKAYFRRAKAYEATNDLIKCLNDVIAKSLLDIFEYNASLLYVDSILNKIVCRIDAEIARVESYLQAFETNPLQTMQLPLTAYSERAHGFLLAILAFDQGRYDCVIPACTEEIEAPQAQYQTEALLLRGNLYFLSGNFDEAKRDYDAVINNSNADFEFRVYACLKRASLPVRNENRDVD